MMVIDFSKLSLLELPAQVTSFAVQENPRNHRGRPTQAVPSKRQRLHKGPGQAVAAVAAAYRIGDGIAPGPLIRERLDTDD